MGSDDVEAVRQTFDAVMRGDYQGAARGFHPDAVWHNTATFPGPRECVGPAAIVEFWETLFESFDDVTGGTRVERVVEGDDRVVLGVHSVGRGKASGAPLEVRWAAAFFLREGRISRVDVHGDWSKALAAAGLREPG